MHFVRRWCHCRKQCWKSFSGLPHTNVFTLLWMSERSAILRPFRALYNFGKSQKSQGVKSGEEGGWSIFCTEILRQELANSTNHTQGYCHSGESTYQARVRVFSSEQILVTLSALPNNTVNLPFVLVQWIYSELSPCDRRNTQAWSWPAIKTCVFFSADVNSVFSTAYSVVFVWNCIENTTFHHR